MQTLHVIMNQQHLEGERLPGKTVVVLDVLFATTTIAMALAQGAGEVLTVAEIEEAREHANGEGVILAGEKDAMVPEGFVHFAPLALSRQPLSGKRLVLTTTNGTVALDRARPARHVYTAALVNARAIVTRILEAHADGTVLLVCSASRHRFNIEDFVGAGLLVERLSASAPERFNLTDAAVAARRLAEDADLGSILHDSRVGRMMHEMNLSDDVDFAARVDAFDIVPKLVNGVIVGV